MNVFRKIYISLFMILGITCMSSHVLFAMKDERSYSKKIIDWFNVRKTSYQKKYAHFYATIEQMFQDLNEPLSVQDFLKQYPAEDQYAIFYSLVLKSQQPSYIQKEFNVNVFFANVLVASNVLGCDKNQIFDFCYNIPLYTRFIYEMNGDGDGHYFLMLHEDLDLIGYSLADITKNMHRDVVAKIEKILSFIIKYHDVYSYCRCRLEKVFLKIIALPIENDVLSNIFLQFFASPIDSDVLSDIFLQESQEYWILLSDFFAKLSIKIDKALSQELVDNLIATVLTILNMLPQEDYTIVLNRLAEFCSLIPSAFDVCVSDGEYQEGLYDVFFDGFIEFLENPNMNAKRIHELNKEYFLLLHNFELYQELKMNNFDFSLIPGCLHESEYFDLCNHLKEYNFSDEDIVSLFIFLNEMPEIVQKTILMSNFLNIDSKYGDDGIRTNNIIYFYEIMKSFYSNNEKLLLLLDYCPNVWIFIFSSKSCYNVIGDRVKYVLNLISEYILDDSEDSINNFLKINDIILVKNNQNRVVDLAAQVPINIDHAREILGDKSVQAAFNSIGRTFFNVLQSLERNNSRRMQLWIDSKKSANDYFKLQNNQPRESLFCYDGKMVKISNHSLTIQSVKIDQVPVMKQVGNACGYHALFNVVQGLQIPYTQLSTWFSGADMICKNTITSWMNIIDSYREFDRVYERSLKRELSLQGTPEHVNDLSAQEIDILARNALGSSMVIFDAETWSDGNYQESKFKDNSFLCIKDEDGTIILPVIFHTGSYHWVSVIFRIKVGKSMSGVYFDSLDDSLASANIKKKLGLIIQAVKVKFQIP